MWRVCVEIVFAKCAWRMCGSSGDQRLSRGPFQEGLRGVHLQLHPAEPAAQPRMSKNSNAADLKFTSIPAKEEIVKIATTAKSCAARVSGLAASFSITPRNGISLAGRPGPKFATAVTFRTATSLRQQLLKSGSRPKVVKHEVPYQALPQ